MVVGNTYRTDYTYSGGYQDRYEREFYGFKTVTENHAPETINNPLRKNISRQFVQTYYNSDFYRRGLVQTTVTRDLKTENVWSKSESDHQLLSVKDDKGKVVADTIFPALHQTTTSFYDGTKATEGGREKYTYQTFAYDSYGNVTTFFDIGELSTDADNVTANIGYYTDLTRYIIKPQEIKVFGVSNSAPLRWRKSDYDPITGNMTGLTLHNTKGPESVWIWNITITANSGGLQMP